MALKVDALREKMCSLTYCIGYVVLPVGVPRVLICVNSLTTSDENS